MKFLLAVSLILICVVSFFSGAVTYANLNKPTPIIKPVEPNEILLFELVNKWRANQNLKPYKENELLCDQTSLRVHDVQTDLSHNGFKTRFEGKYNMAENISTGYNEQDALSNWLVSPTHRKNLDANYEYSCIRCIKDKCVQLFANY